MSNDPELEFAHELNDLILYSTETKKLYKILYDLIQAQIGVISVTVFEIRHTIDMDAEGNRTQRLETPDECVHRMLETRGRIDGMNWLPQEVNRLMRKAEADNASKNKEKS